MAQPDEQPDSAETLPPPEDPLPTEIEESHPELAPTLLEEDPEHAPTLLESDHEPTKLDPPSEPELAATLPESPPSTHTQAPPQVTQAAATTSDSGPVEPDEPGEWIGDYRVERELARGGMGVVYLARDPALGRRVAVKAMLAGAFASKQALERFQIEARAAASLRHPGIVGIHEVGRAPDGRHYLVLDFIEGGSLAERLQREGPLAPRAAAELLRSLSEAVGYAHARGVIHRDLKPANVLLDGDQPMVTDFGLAKEQGSVDGPTRSGQLMGTPAYMPPEQAAGEAVDLRVDVYALGAILYQCLTQRPPFEAESLPALLSKLVDEEPTPLRKLAPQVPVDLETIVATCLEKEPEHRYASAEALADDLGRFLREEPILARPASLAHRANKWLRRNRALAGSVGAVLILALVVGALGTAWFVERLRQRSAEAREGQQAAEQAAERLAAQGRELAAERDEANRQRAAAEDAERRARAAEAEALRQRDEAETQREVADDAAQDALANLRSSATSMLLLAEVVQGELSEIQDARVRRVRERVLDALLAELERLEDHPRLSFHNHALRAQVYTERGMSLLNAGAPKQSLPFHRKAVQIALKGGAQSRSQLQSSLVSLSIAEQEAGDIAAATSATRSAVSVARSCVAGEDSPLNRSALVAGLLRAGELAEQRGRGERAAEHLREAVRVARRGGVEAEDRRVLAGALFALGKLHQNQRRPEEARATLREAIEVERSRLETQGRSNLQDDMLSHALRALAQLEAARGPAAQRALIEDALAFALRRLRADPGDARALREAVSTRNSLAAFHQAQGELPRAAELLEASLAQARAFHQEHPGQVSGRLIGNSLTQLADLAALQREPQRAARLAAEALEQWRALAREWSDVLQVHQGLLAALDASGRHLRAAGKPREGLALARESVERQRAWLRGRPRDPTARRNLAVVLERLGSSEMELGESERAQAHFEQSAKLRRGLQQEFPQDAEALGDLALILDRLGDLASSRRDHSTAHKSHREAVELLRRELAGVEGPDRRQRSNLAILLRKLGDHELFDRDLAQARALYEQARQLQLGLLKERPTDGGQALELAVTHDREAALAEQEGRLEEAERGYRRALSVYLQLARANRSSLRLVRTLSAGYARLASLLSLRGQGAEALRLIDAADRQAASLAKQVPAHVDLARDMAVMRFQHAELQARHGVLPRALELYRGSLEVLSALVERAPHLAPELKQVREQVEAARGHIARFTQEGAPPAEDPSDELAYAQFLAARGEAAAAGQAYLRALAADLEPGDQREALLGAAKAFAPSDPARASEHLSAWSAALEAASQQARAASAATPPHSPQRRSPEREAAERRTRRLLSQREVAARSRELSPLRQEPVWAEVFPPK